MLSTCKLITKSANASHLNQRPKDASKNINYIIALYSSDECSPAGGGSRKDSSQKGSEGSTCDPCGPCCCAPCPPSDSNPASPTVYDKRKYGHSLPSNNVKVCFNPLPHIPTGIFRNTNCEVLGLGAGKNFLYKNPEYFAFHHMSYYDMHLIMRCYRKPSPKTGRKP